MVQFWSKSPPTPAFPPEAQAHVAADWTLLMWHVAQHISDYVGASLKTTLLASLCLTSMSGIVCLSVEAGHSVQSEICMMGIGGGLLCIPQLCRYYTDWNVLFFSFLIFQSAR